MILSHQRQYLHLWYPEWRPVMDSYNV